LKWREGVEATSFETLAKKDNLDSVHTELLRLEDSVHTIHLELQNIRRKEERMRDINGKKKYIYFLFFFKLCRPSIILTFSCSSLSLQSSQILV